MSESLCVTGEESEVETWKGGEGGRERESEREQDKL